MQEKLISKDFRFIFICVILCAVSLLIGIKYFSKVFPEATIDFKITSFYQLNGIILGIVILIPFILLLLDSLSQKGEVKKI